MESVGELCLLFLLYWAAMTDLCFGKITNRLIAISIFLAAVYFIIFSSEKDVLSILRNSLLPIILLFPLFRLHMIGAGDIKLISMISIFTGLKSAVIICVLTFLLFALCHVPKVKKGGLLKKPMAPWFLISYVMTLI